MLADGLQHQLQAKHCAEPPSWTGRWFSPRGDSRYWRVWACPDHLDGLTRLREFARAKGYQSSVETLASPNPAPRFG